MGTVRLDQITKIFRSKGEDVQAVYDANLTIADGELIVFVGPSGCGKTTCLRMIAGLEFPTNGRVFIDEADVTRKRPRDRKTAMVFQDYALYPHMSVYQNMAFALQNLKFPKQTIQERVSHSARMIGLENLLDRRPRELSGGQRQRVALGRAIVRNPSVFLFDEPLSNLDAKLRTQMRIELIKLHRRLQTTMIYVTHDQVEAMTLGERIVVMRDGRIQQAETPSRIYKRPVNAFVAGFIGSPPMNFFPGVYRQRASRPAFIYGEQIVQLPAQFATADEAGGEERAATLGVRPESIALRSPLTEQDGLPVVRGRVVVIEDLGAESILHIEVAGDQVVMVRQFGETGFSIDENVSLVLDPKKLHLFDGVTEERINRLDEIQDVSDEGVVMA